MEISPREEKCVYSFEKENEDLDDDMKYERETVR